MSDQIDPVGQDMLSMLTELGESPTKEMPAQVQESGPPKPNALQQDGSGNGNGNGLQEPLLEAESPPPAPTRRVPRQPAPRPEVAKAEADARKEEARARQAEAKAAGKTSKLGKLVGSGEIVKIYRRENGERSKVGNYSERDLEGYTDLEDFVWEAIRPTWGYGVYEVVYVPTSGPAREGPEIRFASPTMGPGGSPMTPTAPGSGGVTLRDLRQAEKDGEDRYRKLIEEVKRGGGSDALAASMVEMLRAQNEQAMRMMQEQIARKNAISDRPAPPPPPPDTTGAEAIKALSSIVEKITTAPPPRDDSHDRLLAFMKEERERDRDHRAAEETRRREEERERIRREDEREKQRAELEKARLDHESKQREKDREHQLELAKLSKQGDAISPLEQAAKAIEAVDKIRGNNGMTGMDALGMFIENADSIAEKVGSVILAGRTAAKGDGAAGSQGSQAKVKKIEFPESIATLVDDMKRGAKEKDDSVMVEAVIKTIGRLADNPQWKRAAQTVLLKIGKEDKEGVLGELDGLLTQLVDSKTAISLDQDTAAEVMGALDENWEKILEVSGALIQMMKSQKPNSNS